MDEIRTLAREVMFERLQATGWLDTPEDRADAETAWLALRSHQEDPQPYMPYLPHWSIGYGDGGSSRFSPKKKRKQKKRKR